MTISAARMRIARRRLFRSAGFAVAATALATATVGGGGAATARATAAAPMSSSSSSTPGPKATAARARAALAAERAARLRVGVPVEFGIYPGGGAGAVNGRGEPRPEDPELRQQALDQLRPDGRPFVVHLYDAYTRPADADAVPAWLLSQIDGFTARGLRVELVLRYRPNASAGDIDGYEKFVRSRVRQLGSNTGVTSLQIGNEVNVEVAPDAADGAYTGARRALVRGVIAARHEARRTGAAQLAIGFNWANENGPASRAFFSSLKKTGGKTFARSVDWVGVDAYPGTWGPALPAGDLASAVRKDTKALLRRLRSSLLPAAGLRAAPLVIAESGYPTDHVERSERDQATVMRAAVETVVAQRKRYGVVGYRWFDLRDADSSVPSFESQYGLMRDDYSPKAGFSVYRDLVARHG